MNDIMFSWRDSHIVVFETKSVHGWRDGGWMEGKGQTHGCLDFIFDLRNQIAMCMCVWAAQ